MTSHSSPNWHSHMIEEITMPETDINQMQNVTCPKKVHILRGWLSDQMVLIYLNTTRMSKQTMWKCFFSDLRCVIHTPVSNSCLSREQLRNSTSKKNNKKHSTVANFGESEEEKGAGLVFTWFSWYTKTLYLFGSKNTAKNSHMSR